MRWALVIALAACGRVGFDPIAGSNGAPTDGASSGTRDAKLGDGGGSSATMIDAQPFACANALPITPGMPRTTSTCVGGDHIDGCGPANTQEVVFRLDVPASSSYQIAAYDTGTMNISNSTAQLDSTCTKLSGGCIGLAGEAFTQGQVVYFIVEAAAGGCATIDFSVIAN